MINAFTVFSLSAQKQQEIIVNFLDSIKKTEGINPDLVNGYVYVPNYHIGNHPYFLNNEWKEGTIYINENTFPGHQIKYNINRDVLVLKAKIEKDVFKLVQVNKLLIDSFRIDNRLFVNSKNYFENTDKPVFYEQIFNENLTFIRKYSKSIRLESDSRYGRFTTKMEERYIIKDGELNGVNNKWAFVRSFPKDTRKKIRKYFRKHNIRYSQASSIGLYNIMKFCSKVYD
jgi:hypothetical protein